MKIGQIAYANTEPFFHFWKKESFDLHAGHPKGLAEAARRDEIIAGPLPLVECWALEDKFVPLGNWGIAARERCRSVYVLSRVPFSELDHIMIGVTRESATSVKLCEILIRQRYGNDVRMRRGLQMTDAAWLVIGDQALQLANSPIIQTWPYVTDLATEWWNWQQRPFVFAQWIVRKDVAPEITRLLSATLSESFEHGIEHLEQIAGVIAPRLKVAPAFIKSYLSEFLYKLDGEALESAERFRSLIKLGAVHEPAAH